MYWRLLNRLSQNELSEYYALLGEAKFEKLGKMYPNYLRIIFGSFLCDIVGGYDGVKICYEYFILGNVVNVNDIIAELPSDSIGPTLLTYACEYHDAQLIEFLIEIGADPEVVNTGRCTPLENVFYGHSYDYQFNHQNIIECLDVLVKANVKKELSQHKLNHFRTRDYYINNDTIRSFLDSCTAV